MQRVQRCTVLRVRAGAGEWRGSWRSVIFVSAKPAESGRIQIQRDPLWLLPGPALGARQMGRLIDPLVVDLSVASRDA